MNEDQIIHWLLEGDVSIQYQVHRDLLGSEKPELRERIAKEGWGAAFLSHRAENGHWGRGFYQPKWTSSHYTLLDLKNLGIAPGHPQMRETICLILENHKGCDGGVNPAKTVLDSDVCVNGMFLSYASYVGIPEEDLTSVVDFLLSQQMPDGGFNCQSNMGGAVHSSLHSTISVAEGIREYTRNGYTYRLEDLQSAESGCRAFILQHRLYKSDRTEKVIDEKYLMLSYPSRWRYDILRALDYFQSAGLDYDQRMEDALEVLLKKRRKDGTWPVQARHPGQTHFEMEKTGKPSRWNTLRALRVLEGFRIRL
jgi:hypothetical protein